MKEVLMKFNSDFQKKIFQRVIKKYGGSLKATHILKIPASSIRGYKNLYFTCIPKIVIDKLIKIKIINSRELKENLLSTFTKDEQIRSSLNLGRELRKEYFRRIRSKIPHIEEVVSSNCLDVLKWFQYYQNLLNTPFRSVIVEHSSEYINLYYSNFTKNGFRKFHKVIPNKFILDNEFTYFLGLWCGDRAGGKRFGICNQNQEIIKFSEHFLIKYKQEVEKILYITKSVVEPSVEYNKKFIIDKETKGWVLSTHSNNGVLASFFYYLYFNLNKLLDIIKNKEIFFAGLFDAEGNVSLYNKSFRWACRKADYIKIYTKYLKKLYLYNKYDGSCMVSYNRKRFYKLILPYLKHKEKINKVFFLCKGQGDLLKEHIQILTYINKHPGIMTKEIAKGLKKTKVYSELRILNDFDFISHKDYPYKFRITAKGLKSLGGLKL